MIVDTSALIAILLGEPEAGRMIAAVVAAPVRLIAAPTLVEAAAVMVARKGAAGEVALDALIGRLDLETVPMSAAAAQSARHAWRRFGKGTGSPAALNFGDCLSYGVAADAGEPLLCKGRDFEQTDLALVDY